MIYRKVKDLKGLDERLKLLLSADDRAGQLVRAITYQSLAYASERIPEVADTPKPIDDAMRWGFGREAGPFESWDLLGVSETCEKMRQAGFPPASWVGEMLAAGFNTFYQKKDGIVKGVYDPRLRNYQQLEQRPGLVLLPELRAASKVIKKNPGAYLYDIGDGVLGLEFRTKMGTLDPDVFGMLVEGLDRLETGFEGLVIGGDDENFSAGANVFLVVMSAQNGQWDQLEQMIKSMQDILMQVRYSPKPVIAAPAGLALGGGAEIMMSASRVVAGAELYTGMVEIGMGIIPSGSGTKELLRRIVNPPMQTKGVRPSRSCSGYLNKLVWQKLPLAPKKPANWACFHPKIEL